jgi:hypothetical protein
MSSEIVRRIPVDYTCPDLFGQHVLHVVELQFEIMPEPWWNDEVGVLNILYTITPSIPMPNVDPATGHWFVMWLWSAVDDMGTAYMDVGGAYGPSQDHQATHGDLSLRPLPPAHARSLTITLSLAFDGGVTQRACSFTVDLTASTR